MKYVGLILSDSLPFFSLSLFQYNALDSWQSSHTIYSAYTFNEMKKGTCDCESIILRKLFIYRNVMCNIKMTMSLTGSAQIIWLWTHNTAADLIVD